MKTIKVLNENVIKALSSVKEDNVSIADVVIDRRKLLAALKLQNQPGSDILTINYGSLSFEDRYKNQGYYSSGWHEVKVDNETCVQFSCNHTVMRFLNRPHKVKYGQEPKIIPLNFVDHKAEPVKQELTGIPIDTPELIETLNFVIHGVETDGTRPPLECVCFDCSKDTLQLVTADGYRLPIAKMKVKGMTKKQALIHRLDIPKMLTFLKNNYTGKGKSKDWLDTYLDMRELKTMFMSDKGMVEFDNQTGSYPDYTRLVPKGGTKIEFIASDMLEAVKALQITAKEGSSIVRLKFTHGEPIGNINLSSHYDSHDGDNVSSVDCQAVVESDCKIGVDYRYLIDLLKQCGDSKITMRVTQPSSPMVFDVSGSKQETIMPMFVQWEDTKAETPKVEEPEEDYTEESEEPTPEDIKETVEV